MEGLDLLKYIIESTGLPPNAVDRELKEILASRGLRAESLTLEDVRDVLSIYLQDVLIAAKDSAV